MQFNKVIRGAKRALYEEQAVYDILDAGFLCHIAFQHHGQTMMIPTAYGREGDALYIHGSTKNTMMNAILDGQTCCISVTHLDGIVLANTLFDTSANYRTVVLFGKAEKVDEEAERMHALKVITEQIIPHRWEEVPVGTQQELKATLVIKFTIETASAKVRGEGPNNEAAGASWSGHIPLKMQALPPVEEVWNSEPKGVSKSVAAFCKQYQ